MIDLSRQDLSGQNLSDRDLCQANMMATKLNGCSVRNSNLNGANLEGAELRGCDFNNASLCGAILTDTDCSGSNFCGVDFAGANLRGANLENTNLFDVNLRGVDVTGTIFHGCKGLTKEMKSVLKRQGAILDRTLIPKDNFMWWVQNIILPLVTILTFIIGSNGIISFVKPSKPKISPSQTFIHPDINLISLYRSEESFPR